MARYIDADKFIKWIEKQKRLSKDYTIFMLQETAAAKVKEIKYGKWEVFGLRNPLCSLCHKYNYEKTDFCPHCGADMRGVE
jgi:hypothetical protein